MHISLLLLLLLLFLSLLHIALLRRWRVLAHKNSFGTMRRQPGGGGGGAEQNGWADLGSSPSCIPRTKCAAYLPLSSGSSEGSSELRPKRGSLMRLMLGPQLFSPMRAAGSPARWPPELAKARSSVAITRPFCSHTELLKEAASSAGDGNVVAHRPGARQADPAPVLASVAQWYGGISSRGTPASMKAQGSLPVLA